MSLLRIAVPNKGSLSQSASEILREAGYRQRDDSKQLTLTDTENGVEFFYLRPRDIALYVGEGTLDVGITGRDLLLRLRREGRRGDGPRVRPQPVPVRRPAGRRTPTSASSPGCGSRRRTSASSARSWRSAASTRP